MLYGCKTEQSYNIFLRTSFEDVKPSALYFHMSFHSETQFHKGTRLWFHCFHRFQLTGYKWFPVKPRWFHSSLTWFHKLLLGFTRAGLGFTRSKDRLGEWAREKFHGFHGWQPSVLERLPVKPRLISQEADWVSHLQSIKRPRQTGYARVPFYKAEQTKGRYASPVKPVKPSSKTEWFHSISLIIGGLQGLWKWNHGNLFVLDTGESKGGRHREDVHRLKEEGRRAYRWRFTISCWFQSISGEGWRIENEHFLFFPTCDHTTMPQKTRSTFHRQRGHQSIKSPWRIHKKSMESPRKIHKKRTENGSAKGPSPPVKNRVFARVNRVYFFVKTQFRHRKPHCLECRCSTPFDRLAFRKKQ